MLIFFVISNYLKAQNSISGIVSDTSCHPINYATVVLYKNDTIKLGTITDIAGNYKFEKVKSDKYIISFNCVGYQGINRNIELLSDINLDTIKLNIDENFLNEVTITSNRNEVVTGVAKSIFTITPLMRKQSFNSFQLLTNVPDLLVNPIDKTISINEKGNILVLIDNVPREMSDISAISPKNIDKIEIITNPSAKYLSQDVSGVINIITKGNTKGFLGDVDLKINPLLKSGFLNADFKYSRNKFSFFIRSFASLLDEKQTFEQKAVTSTKNGLIVTDFIKSLHSNSLLHSGSVKTGIEYQINKTSYLLFDSYFDKVKSTGETDYYGLVSENYRSAMDYNSKKSNKSDENAQKYSLYFQKQFDNKSVLAILAKYNNFYSNYKTNFAKQSLTIDFQNNTQTENNKKSFDVQSDYVYEIGKHEMNIGHRFYSQNVLQDIFYYNIPYAENRFKYQEFRNYMYCNFSGGISKKISYQSGIGIEKTDISINDRSYKNNYLKLLPTLGLQYKVSQKGSFNLNYNGSMQRPSVTALNPTIRYLDSLKITSGNPDLEPYFINNFIFSYSQSVSILYFKISMEYNFINNDIASVGESDNTGIYKVSYQNIAHYDYLTPKLTTRIKLKDWFSLNTSIYSIYTKYNDDKNQINTSLNSFGFNFSSNMSYKKFYLSLSYTFKPKYLDASNIGKFADDSRLSIFWQPFDQLTLGCNLRYFFPWNEYYNIVDLNYTENYKKDFKDRYLLVLFEVAYNFENGKNRKQLSKRIDNNDNSEELK